MFALVGGINNVLKAYRSEGYLYENPLLTASSLIVIYLAATMILAFITFKQNIKFKLRALLLLFVFYALGTIGMTLSSFSAVSYTHLDVYKRQHGQSATINIKPAKKINESPVM